jgi:hypothetical protein
MIAWPARKVGDGAPFGKRSETAAADEVEAKRKYAVTGEDEVAQRGRDILAILER